MIIQSYKLLTTEHIVLIVLDGHFFIHIGAVSS